jgi:hypothetical protein
MPVTYPAHVIDVHTHVFNAHHLPVEGMLLRWMGVEEGRGFRGWLARRAKDITVLLVDRESRRSRQNRTQGIDALVSGLPENETSETLFEDLYARIIQAVSIELGDLEVGAVARDTERLSRQMQALLLQEWISLFSLVECFRQNAEMSMQS